MPEEYLLHRRNRLKKHFVVTSNVLLYGYRSLSDGAKVTYQVIDSFDWEDESRVSKGYAFPAVGTVARIRGVSERTIQRHLRELMAAGLLTRQERPGETNILIIEEVSEKEAQVYLRRYTKTGDKNVAPPPTNLSPETEEVQKNEVSVNENEKGTGRTNERDSARSDLPVTQPSGCKAGKAIEGEAWLKREYYAREMLKVLGDQHSLGCYRALAESCPTDVIFEALSLVKEAARGGRIKKSKGALFVDIVKRSAGSRGITLPWEVRGVPTPRNNVGQHKHSLYSILEGPWF